MPMPFVEILGVTHSHTLHQTRKSGMISLDEEMHMVFHERSG